MPYPAGNASKVLPVVVCLTLGVLLVAALAYGVAVNGPLVLMLAFAGILVAVAQHSAAHVRKR